MIAERFDGVSWQLESFPTVNVNGQGRLPRRLLSEPALLHGRRRLGRTRAPRLHRRHPGREVDALSRLSRSATSSALTFGTRMAAVGVPMRILQEWMGHASIDTTMIYADYSPSEHETAMAERAFRHQIWHQSEQN